MLQRWQAALRALMLDEDLPPGLVAPWMVAFLRFWVRVGQAFARNQCPVRASALAYTSLLALIPLLALVVGIASTVLKGEKAQIETNIRLGLNSLVPQAESHSELVKIREQVTSFVMSSIDNVNSGTIGVTGMIALIVMIIFMLARIEETLNEIWGVSVSRSWYARVVNYWATISLGPIVVFAAVSFTAALKTAAIQKLLATLPSVTSHLIGLAPIPILAGGCALFYALVPNTKVQWRAALLGGLTAGVLWHVNNTMSVLFVSRISRDSKIFGVLAPLPVFMVGLYFFWLLLLFGSQVAYVYQNRRTQLALKMTERVHQEGREFVALRVMIEAGRAFRRAEEAPSIADLSQRLEVPGELLSQIVRVLLRARLLVEASVGDTGLMPARPLEDIRVSDVVAALRRGTGQGMATRRDSDRERAEGEMARLGDAERKAGSRTLSEILTEAERR
ncbi:MAG: YihY family inner membrane protein [Verrucomicrobiales bacterium]|nr:YihY family inner membrane protein [Verrucomicrobiales bacterium]